MLGGFSQHFVSVDCVLRDQATEYSICAMVCVSEFVFVFVCTQTIIAYCLFIGQL